MNTHFKGLYINEQMLFYHWQVLNVRIRTCHEEIYLTMYVNSAEYIGTLIQRN